MPMIRCVTAVLMVMGLCLVLSAGTSVELLALAAPAQEKKTDKKESGNKTTTTKGEVGSSKDTKVGSGGTVEVYQAKDGWRFRIKNAQGKSLAIGVVGYATKEEALQVIQQVQEILNTQKAVIVEKK
jgi:uncharacterized protein YegP (UPF0339 family)